MRNDWNYSSLTCNSTVLLYFVWIYHNDPHSFSFYFYSHVMTNKLSSWINIASSVKPYGKILNVFVFFIFVYFAPVTDSFLPVDHWYCCQHLMWINRVNICMLYMEFWLWLFLYLVGCSPALLFPHQSVVFWKRAEQGDSILIKPSFIHNMLKTLNQRSASVMIQRDILTLLPAKQNTFRATRHKRSLEKTTTSFVAPEPQVPHPGVKPKNTKKDVQLEKN